MSGRVHREGSIQKWGDDNDKEFTIYPKDLSIVWGNDSRYWSVPAGEDNGPAELLEVAWLEVSATARVERNKKYRVEFEVEVKQNGFGWNSEVVAMAKAGRRGKYIPKRVLLSTDGPERTITTDGPAGALEIEMNSEDLLHFGLYEVWSGRWKGGLLIKKAKITNLSSPENKITNLSSPVNKITKVSSPENKITNLSSPENKIIKISIPEEEPDYCGEFIINYKCNVQFNSLTFGLVTKNKGL